VLVTWLLFDYGNVICYPQPPRAVERLAEAAGATVADFSAGYWKYRLAYDHAKLDAVGYWQRVGESVGRTFSATDIARLTSLDNGSWLDLNPGTVSLVEDLAAGGGNRLALLSNAPAEVARAVMALPVAALFEHRLFSCFLRLVKPDPAIFLAALGRLGASAADVIFLDDRPENVAGAAEVGIRGVVFTDPGTARSELARQGVVTESTPSPGSKSASSD
jgi:putative hydrolase of the HAD superfamily